MTEEVKEPSIKWAGPRTNSSRLFHGPHIFHRSYLTGPSAVCQRWRRETSCFDRRRMAWCLESTLRRHGAILYNVHYWKVLLTLQKEGWVKWERKGSNTFFLQTSYVNVPHPQSLPPAFLSGQLLLLPLPPLLFPLRVRWSMAASPILPFLLLHNMFEHLVGLWVMYV